MRLLSTRAREKDDSKPLELREFVGNSIPPYAILSHTWGDGEVLFEDVRSGDPQPKAGFDKITGTMRQAWQDGFDYAWIDTCCIDKSSSAELSEAINSMFAYYRNCGKAYAYLSDVGPDSKTDFETSRWWTRGWTLQELLAPETVEFYDSLWRPLGSKQDLSDSITRASGISSKYLHDPKLIETASVARRMSWASKRVTTRIEDTAYCLLGLFDVNMPMLYGEGKKAFMRLQEELLKQSDDQSIFAWQDPDDQSHGLLADGPHAFRNTGDIAPYGQWIERAQPVMTSRGLNIELPLVLLGKPDTFHAILDCFSSDDRSSFIAIQLRKTYAGMRQFTRVNCGELGRIGKSSAARKTTLINVKRPSYKPSSDMVYPVQMFRDHYIQLRSWDGKQIGLISNVRILERGRSTVTYIKLNDPLRKRDWPGQGVFSQLHFLPDGKPSVIINMISTAPPLGRYALTIGSLSHTDLGFDFCITEKSGLNYRPRPMGSTITCGSISARVTAATLRGEDVLTFAVDIHLDRALSPELDTGDPLEAQDRRLHETHCQDQGRQLGSEHSLQCHKEAKDDEGIGICELPERSRSSGDARRCLDFTSTR